MPVPTRDPVPLGRSRRAHVPRANPVNWYARRRSATLKPGSLRVRPMPAEPPHVTNASGTRAAAPFARCAIASSAASDGRGGRAYWHPPCHPHCCVARPRRRGVAGRCAPWGSGRLALGRTRRSAARRRSRQLSITVRAVPGSGAAPPSPVRIRVHMAPPCSRELVEDTVGSHAAASCQRAGARDQCRRSRRT